MITLRCPHCASEVQLALISPALPQKVKGKAGVCACGHDAHNGPCPHGKGTTFGGCPCPGMHSRRRGASSPAASGALLEWTPGQPPKPVKTRKNGTAVIEDLTTYQRALLRVLKQHGSVNRAQLALIAGYSPNSGTFTEALAVLRSKGLLERLVLTPAGELAAGIVEALPTGEGLVRYWCERVGEYAGTLLQVLVTAYPHDVSREELAERAGYRASGTFTEQIAKLRKLGLITKRGLRASESFMGGVRLMEAR